MASGPCACGQTIVFLAYLCQLQPGQTHLIIVPASVLANWENEFARFAPHVRVVRYHGSTQDRAALRDEYQYVYPPANPPPLHSRPLRDTH